MEADLPITAVVLGSGEVVTQSTAEHGIWLVASQDCDLNDADADDNTPTIELRKVLTEDVPMEWGIRSRRLRISDEYYIHSDDPRLHVSPAALSALAEQRLPGFPIPDRSLALKTWLGKRYDRPAVPDEWLFLADRIAKEVGRKRHQERIQEVRDVLMQFEDGDPPRYTLIAVTTAEADALDVRRWLADVASAIPAVVAVADDIQVGTADEVSFSVIETSYAADVTQVTWSGESPKGAH